MTVPSATRRWTFDRMVSTVVPETDSTVIVAVQNRVERIDLNRNTREVLARIDDRNGSVRTNDGKCDPAGRLCSHDGFCRDTGSRNTLLPRPDRNAGRHTEPLRPGRTKRLRTDQTACLGDDSTESP